MSPAAPPVLAATCVYQVWPRAIIRLRVALTGFKTWENSITVAAGETVTAFVPLEKQNLQPTVTLDADRNSIAAGQNRLLTVDRRERHRCEY